jgi:iron(III) transport system ATP-binding protein
LSTDKPIGTNAGLSAHSDTTALQISGMSVDYPGCAALTRIDLTVAKGELVAVLGPSGAGKSTLLNAIAGLVAPTEGEISLAGQLVATPRMVTPPERRGVGLVFQNYALWPHLTALATVAYPMRRTGTGRADSDRAALELLQRLGIGHLADRRPAELSGGEQQRVGLARALARNPMLYLLDEPTAHLDTSLRATFQTELRNRQLRSGASAVCATHDPAEALAIADRIALLIGGRIVQIGGPTEVYERPASVAAARLTGTVSVLAARCTMVDDELVSIDLGAASAVVAGGCSANLEAGRHSVLVRPEWTTDAGPFSGQISAVWFRGPHTDYLVGSPAGDVVIRQSGPPRHRLSEHLSWGLDRAWVVADGNANAQQAQPNAIAAPG